MVVVLNLVSKERGHFVMQDKLQYPQGIKWTKQRKCVYEILERAMEPMSAAQIYQAMEEAASESVYAFSTVYRILSTFEEHKIVNKSTFMGEGTVVYELNRGEHTHYAVCLECKKRVALPVCPFAHAHLEQGTEGFTVTGHKLELYGYCKECEKIQEQM